MSTLRNFRRLATVAAALAAVALADADEPRVGVLLGDAVSPFGAGLAKAFSECAASHGMSIVVKSPPAAENVAQMQRLLGAWQNDPELKGVVIACGLGAADLGRSVQPLVARGVPVIALLGRMPPGTARCAVLVDENSVVSAAVEQVSRLLAPGDELSMLRSNLRESQMNDRERLVIQGVRERVANLTIHADVFMNAEGATPQSQGRLLLEKYPKTTVVYSPYTTATLAMAASLRDNGRAGKVHHVGIGAGVPPELGQTIENGELDALIAMNPRDVAEKSLATMAALLAGKDVPAEVYSKVEVVTKANLASQVNR